VLTLLPVDETRCSHQCLSSSTRQLIKVLVSPGFCERDRRGVIRRPLIMSSATSAHIFDVEK